MEIIEMKHKTRRSKRTQEIDHRMVGGSLRTSYGVVIVPKGTRLYHLSTSTICSIPEKPMIFTTVHPSEWYSENAYISVLEVKKDIELLFMISQIKRSRVFSSLNRFLTSGNTNMAKMDYERIKTWLPYLKKENLDGWFSSIQNGFTIELAIIGTQDRLKLIECNPIQYSWANSKYLNDSIEPKNWGTYYPISTKYLPLKMFLNSRYSSQIEDYKKFIANEEPFSTSLSIILENANITYFDSPLEEIKWI